MFPVWWPRWSLVERAVLLRAIDSLWVEHLTELDDFRRGVGLRMGAVIAEDAADRRV